jgi:hypothetical protein
MGWPQAQAAALRVVQRPALAPDLVSPAAAALTLPPKQ